MACKELRTEVGTAAACRSLNITRPTFYRRLTDEAGKKPATRSKPPRALSKSERQKVLDILHTERFVDKAPTEV
jgi:putative transposase